MTSRQDVSYTNSSSGYIRLNSTRELFPRNFIAANVTRKSLTRYENVVRVGSDVLRGCCEDAAGVLRGN